MKHTTIVLILLVLTLVTFNLSCDGKTSPPPQPNAATSPAPTPRSSPTPETHSGNLVEATSGGEVSYEFSGTGDSTKMNLKVRNESERTWEVKIEVGTKIEPDESDVQQMVVTREIEVHLEPHDHHDLVIDVGCLDISKAAPSKTNTKWRLEASTSLNQFIRCANDAFNDLKARGEAEEEDRRGLIQLALWQARGATHDQWVKFYEDYQDKSPEEAEKASDETAPIAKKVITHCPPL
jgi:hypothetical protein